MHDWNAPTQMVQQRPHMATALPSPIQDVEVLHSITHTVLVTLGVFLGILHTVALLVFLYYAYTVQHGINELQRTLGH